MTEMFSVNIVTYIRGVTIIRGLDWLMDLLHLYTQLLTTSNYSAIADLHTLQFTVTPHTTVFSLH
jgi:hypothetical protein